jgi:hypothetical protein
MYVNSSARERQHTDDWSDVDEMAEVSAGVAIATMKTDTTDAPSR